MPLPNLIHPVNIIVDRLDVSSTVMDDDFREPVSQGARIASVTVPGQVRWGKAEGLKGQPAGPSYEYSGYVTFRKTDLDALSFMIKEGDRLKNLGSTATDVYVVGLQWLGHYPDQAGPSLLRAYFHDRRPAKLPGSFP